MISTILEFRNVSFSRGPRLLLDRMSFGIEKQEMIALVGPNGVGKTTLLKLASRLLPPASGEILLDGKPLPAWSRRELPRAVALVPQELEIPFNFPVEEIVAQGRVPHQPLFASQHARRIARQLRAQCRRWTSWGCVTASIRSCRAANASA